MLLSTAFYVSESSEDESKPDPVVTTKNIKGKATARYVVLCYCLSVRDTYMFSPSISVAAANTTKQSGKAPITPVPTTNKRKKAQLPLVFSCSSTLFFSTFRSHKSSTGSLPTMR